MRIPYRKPGKYSQIEPDRAMTERKINELKNKLEKLKNYSRPQAAAEVRRLSELGDFSENVEYQLAKRRLRGINNSILSIENQINHAVIIETPSQTDTVQIGHKVTVERDNQKKIYQILGSSETHPQMGIISHNSPLGFALLGRKVGDRIVVKQTGREIKYRIVGIM